MIEARRGLPGWLFLGLAAVAGILAGTVAVYVRGSANSNGTADAVNCTDAVASAKRLAPFAVGELAAFKPADKPDSVGDLVFKAADGNPTSLSAFAGRVVLVNLWATWCVPCRAEMPALDRLQAVKGGTSFTVVPVNVDVQNPERAKAFLADIGVAKLGFYSDPTMEIFNKLKGRGLALGLPTTLLVDAKGCRLGTVEGPAAWDSDQAKALIDAAVARPDTAG
ncbi:MAG TPA: TlpA disulfide reductase family protein [Bauldia sp.]|jgi:thiol-disulfide isomerase/thioredoxin